MSDTPQKPNELPQVRAVTPPQEVPVYNCPVILSPPNVDGVILARSATLADIVGQGKSQREALQEVVTNFKIRIARHHALEEEIPWLDPPLKPAEGEQEFLTAIHL